MALCLFDCLSVTSQRSMKSTKILKSLQERRKMPPDILFSEAKDIDEIHSCNWRLVVDCMWSIKWHQYQWPWVTLKITFAD